MGIINNLDLEHLDCYESLKDLQNAFAELENTIQDGRARIGAEHKRQTRVRKANLNALQKKEVRLF